MTTESFLGDKVASTGDAVVLSTAGNVNVIFLMFELFFATRLEIFCDLVNVSGTDTSTNGTLDVLVVDVVTFSGLDTTHDEYEYVGISVCVGVETYVCVKDHA
jgi:hypothetical protein